MNELNVLEKVERNTYRYWYTDGLAELASGCTFALLSVFFWIQATTQSRLIVMLSAFVLPVLVIGGSLLSRRIIAAGKDRLTYPRTGYVAYRPVKKSLGLRAGILGAFLAIIAVLAVQRVELPLGWMIVAEGVAIGAGLAYYAHKFGLARFYALAILSVFAGVGAGFATANAELGNAMYFGAVAVGFLVSGGMTLLAYLRQTRLPEEAGDE
jgi:hypothetical protein